MKVNKLFGKVEGAQGIVISHLVDPKGVPADGEVAAIGVWMRHPDLLLCEAEKIGLLNALLEGPVVLVETASNAYVVRWFVRVMNTDQARTAARKLGEIVSDILGIDLMQWESETKAGANNALIA